MIWNFDFDISAIVIITTLILYYVYRKPLPLIHNLLFLALMVLSDLVAITDVVASIMTSYGGRFTIPALYGINMLYYLCLISVPAVFCNYAAALSHKQVIKTRSLKYVFFSIPFLIMVLMDMITPFYHTFFSINSNHIFSYEGFRPVIFYETVLYLLLGGAFVLAEQTNLRVSERYSVYIYLGLSLLGHIYQCYINPYIQTVSLANTVGILIVFLIHQNPDYDRDRRSGMYREMGVVKMKAEDLLYGLNRSYLTVAVENYKELRSSYGEVVSDHVLFELGKFLRSRFPRMNHFYVHNGKFVCDYARYGVKAEDYAKVVFDRCKEPFYIDGLTYYISPYIVYTDGDVVMENHRVMRDTMRIAADEAASMGAGTILHVTEAMHQKAIRSVKIDSVLNQALQGDNLLIYYQPIYGIKERRIVGAEALVRLYDKEMGLIMPDEFIWRAEETGRVLKLGEQVFRKVCQFVKKSNMESLGLQFIEVNLSPLQCMREQLAEEFQEIMKEYGVDPKYICLEITESHTVNIDVVRENMVNLSNMGVSFALDDYGTGYSNLVNVLSLPLNIVKIDKSIVWAYFNEGNKLLTKVISMFENENLRLVVEGVETEEMACKLEELGCHYEQGYFYSKPIPEYAFLKYVTDQRY